MGGLRRSGRIKKEIGIVLLGTDTQGHVFSEETRTVALSYHGAGIVSKHKLSPDEILTLRFLRGSTEVAVRLVGEMGEDARGHVYGVAFVDPELDFWQIDFPSPPHWVTNGDTSMECSLCHTCEVVEQSEIEADVYALTRGILRFCATCGNSTTWHEAAARQSLACLATDREVIAEAVPESTEPEPYVLLKPIDVSNAAEELPESCTQPSPAPGKAERKSELGREPAESVQVAVPEGQHGAPLPPTAAAVVARTSNRRRDVRTRVSFTASIRQDDAGEEIVECDNISRGGISFRSRKTYAMESQIEVAAPYSPGWHAIFVSARIGHAEQLPGGNLTRYGAVYVKAGSH